MKQHSLCSDSLILSPSRQARVKREEEGPKIYCIYAKEH